MADQKITDFSADTSPAAADLVTTVKSGGGAGSNRKVTLTNIAALINASPTITGHATIEGVTATGATGTGNFVFSAAPTFTGTVTAPTLKTTTLFATTDGAGAFVFNKADGTTNVLTLNTTTQEAKLTQIGANATGYADQRSSGIFNFESSQWNGSAAVAGNWSLQGVASTGSNTNTFTLKYGSSTYLSIISSGLGTFVNFIKVSHYFTSTTTPPKTITITNSSTTANNYEDVAVENAGGMTVGRMAFKNTSHHASTGSANYELWLANSTTADKVMETTATGNHVVGRQAAVATNATDGFLYIPTCAGTPTGVPTAYTGKCAMVMDTTNHKLYVYDGSWLAMN